MPAPEITAGDVRFIELGSTDAAAVLAHLCRLSRSDREARFGMPMTDGAIAACVAHASFRLPRWMDRWYGAVDAERRIVGFAHLYLDGRRAEAALSVDAPLRRRGVGLVLLRRAIREAHGAGVSRIVLCGVQDHSPVASLARRAGMFLRGDGSVRSAELDLAAGFQL